MLSLLPHDDIDLGVDRIVNKGGGKFVHLVLKGEMHGLGMYNLHLHLVLKYLASQGTSHGNSLKSNSVCNTLC